jgi:hypothetical protein
VDFIATTNCNDLWLWDISSENVMLQSLKMEQSELSIGQFKDVHN